MKKTKQERKRDQEILNRYHQYVTEKELETLNNYFKQWKGGDLAYYDLTELIHQFHKKNQDIYKTFEYTEKEYLIFMAKKELNLFNEKDRQNKTYQRWIDFVNYSPLS